MGREGEYLNERKQEGKKGRKGIGWKAESQICEEARSALVDAAFQGMLNDFVLLLHLYSSTFQETEDEISKSAFLSLTIKRDINWA